jgi:hypothetical protein
LTRLTPWHHSVAATGWTRALIAASDLLEQPRARVTRPHTASHACLSCAASRLANGLGACARRSQRSIARLLARPWLLPITAGKLVTCAGQLGRALLLLTRQLLACTARLCCCTALHAGLASVSVRMHVSAAVLLTIALSSDLAC